ncbi:MAG: glycoside hydrolase family 2 TIM barrel-domain containing protein [Bacteroidota bacterium]|nr:glycoside hydrolase family 2 TIM barrel-domain containing protein [Bacteroidota bacterium]
MKRTKHTLLLLALLLTSTSLFSREIIRINFDWKFTLGEQKNAQSLKYDDTKWQDVQLPHDASIYGPFVKDSLGGNAVNGYRPKNIGWYRKHLTIDKKNIGKKIFLEFEGVYRASDVWVNGAHCGTFLNGNLDFQYDISKLVLEGDNVIAVRYDNREKSSRWYTGEGIYRDVYLHVLEPVHVDRYGTYITTPKISKESAKVVVETNVTNDRTDSIICKLVTDIVSPWGKVVTTRTSVVPLTGGENFKFHQEMKIDAPVLWDINNPALYKAVTRVFVKEQLSDVYEINFGIREVEFTPEEGFLLNGRKVFLKGVCLHQDLGPLGVAAFESGWEKRLSILKNELGCNAIRLSHNPYPKFVLDWCDRNGILVFDEAYDKWDEQYYGKGNSFQNYWKSDVETWIKRDRNHPSVFIWSVGNEVFQQIRKEQAEAGVTLLKEMTDFVHKLEPSRKVTCAMYPSRFNSLSHRQKGYLEAEPHPIAFYMDVMSVNYMAKFFAKDRQKYPQLTYLISEEVTTEDGLRYFEYDHSYVAGQFYWGGTEYIGESFGWPSKGWINGPIDLCNNFKPLAYNIKSFYKDEPVVRIAVWENKGETLDWNDVKMTTKPKKTSWNWTDDDSLTVQVFSNCEQVELFINGKSQGVKAINRSKPEFIWRVKYEKGEIKAIGINEGKTEAQHIVRTAGTPHRIILETDKSTLSADGLDLAYLKVKVVDKDNIIVPTATNKIVFKVSGTGSNAGVGNGDIKSSELWQADSRSVYNGECQLIVRSGREKGKITVEATSPGLKGMKLQLQTK